MRESVCVNVSVTVWQCECVWAASLYLEVQVRESVGVCVSVYM